MSDSINMPLPNILGAPQEAGEAMAERIIPHQYPATLWLLPPPAPGSVAGGEMKGVFVFSAGNLILRKKGGQGGRRHVCGVLLIQRELLSKLGSCAKQARNLPSSALFTSQRGPLQGPGLGLGPEVTEQRVPSGQQDMWYVLVQAQSPGGGVGETVHRRD